VTLGYIHAYIWGPSNIPSKGGARYFLSLIDDYFEKIWAYVLKQKSDVFKTFKRWKVLVEKQIEKKVKHLCTNNSMDFYSNEFEDFCRDEGPFRHRTTTVTPQQNGVAE